MWVANPSREPWTGSEESIREAQLLADRINAVEPKALADSDADAEPPSLLSKEGNVGVIRVEGQLFASVPDWAKAIFGLVDYSDISNALVEAAKDSSIGAILLDVNSPGGSVSGVDAVAELVDRIDREVKPIHAHTDSLMASAAYWISSGARSISAGPLAHVGSIGVLQVHREYSKLEANEGVTTTVLRAGRYKALGNPYEPLSDDAKSEIQTKLDYTYAMFMGHVADMRGLPYEAANAQMGQGRVFIGELAQKAGLVDKVTTYADALTAAQESASKVVDSRKSLIQNPKKQEGLADMRKKATLTAADVAAIASGAPLEQVQATEPSVEPTAETAPEPTAETAPEPTAVAGIAVLDVKADVLPVAPVQDQSAVVALLEKQLKESRDAEVAARVELKQAQDALAALQAQTSPLVTIARDSVQKMFIALGAAGDHVTALDTSALLEEHAKVSETFKNRFKVGGVAAASAQADDDKPKAQKASPVAAARLKAVRLATTK